MAPSSNKKRLFIISPTESALTIRGKRHPNLAEYLVKHGWDVEYLSTNFSHAEKRNFSESEYVHVQKRVPYELTLIDVGSYKKNLSFKRVFWHQKFAYKCYKKLKQIVNEKDVIIIPSRPPELIWMIARLKHECGCKTVLDIRDIWPDALTTTSGITRYLFDKYCTLFLKNSVCHFDDYVHVAPSYLAWLSRFSVDAISTFIPLGFDEHRWEGRCVNVNSSRIGTGDTVKLVYCGTLTDQFNIKPILQALSSCSSNFYFTIIGDNGSGERYNETIEFIDKHNLSQQVEVVGLLSPEKLVGELRHHHVSIIPMVSGALPNKVFDSIAAGLPMISLGSGDSTDFVKKYDIGWYASFNSCEVINILKELTSSSIHEKSNNVAKCRKLFFQSTLFQKYETILNNNYNQCIS